MMRSAGGSRFLEIISKGKLSTSGQSCCWLGTVFLGSLILTSCSTVPKEIPASSEPVKGSLEHTIARQSKTETREPSTSSETAEKLDNEEAHDESLDEDEDWEAELDQLGPKEINYAERDPLEKMNRFLYGVHRGVDLLFVRPVALTYKKALPKPIQSGLANFVSNLLAPTRALCHLLQGHWGEAGRTLGRFATNTLLGGGGLVDVASKMNAHEISTNFTEALKTWGVKPGPYIVVPGVGPTTARGVLGFLMNSFLDPVFLLTLNKNLPGNNNHELIWKDTAVQTGDLLMTRAKIDSIYEDIEKNSVNRYSKLRALVLQQSSNR